MAKLSPDTLQSHWTGEAVTALTDAHSQVQAAKARGDTALDPHLLATLRGQYDNAVDSGIIHNRHRDWDGDGNHPGYTLATWMKTHAAQVWHFTTHLTWTGPRTPPNAASNPPNATKPSPAAGTPTKPPTAGA